MPTSTRLHWLRRSIAFRYLTTVSLALLIVQLLFSVYGVYTDYSQRLTDLETKVTGQVSFLSAVSPERILKLDFISLEALMRQTNRDPDIVYTVVLDDQGHPLTRFLNRDNPIIAQALVTAPEGNILTIISAVQQNPLVREVRAPITLQDQPLGEVWLGYSLENVQQETLAASLTIVLAAVFVGLLLVSLTLLLFQRLLRLPLQTLTGAAQALAEGNLRERVDTSRGDEISQLGDAFNRMADQLQQTLTGLEQRVAERTAELGEANAILQTEVLERQRAEAAARRQAQELELLDRIRTALARELELPVVFRTAIESMASILGYSQVNIMLIQNDQLILQCQIGYTLEAEATFRVMALNQGICGRVASTGQPALVTNVQADPSYYQTMASVGSEICVPFFSEQQVVGVLDIESSATQTLSEDDLRLITAVAEHVGLAVTRARLHAAVQDRAHELEQAYQTLQDNQEKFLIIEKMAAIGRLTAGIAHEMNTPLAAVRAALDELHKLTNEYTDSIADAQVTADDHHQIAVEMIQAIQVAERAAERTAGFVRGIKAQTRDLATHERQRFNAVQVINEALMLLGHALRHNRCAADFQPASEVMEMLGSPGRLAQVVTNLITNAIDANVAQGGQAIRLSLTQKATTIELQVSDEGCGIAPENLSKIFDPLFTTKPFGEGTGLGLSIVHDIVTGDFGGTLEVTSQVGQGATFTVHLPRPSEIAVE